MNDEHTPDEEVVAEAEAVVDAAASALAEGEPTEPTESDKDWEALAAERTADLQRLQAEYVNYKKRVDRDRALARRAGIEAVVADLMPVLDSITLAKSHEDLAGGFKAVADELEKVAAKHGLVAFGAVGEPFDPNLHEALMQVPMEGVTVTTISQVMQQGYQLGDRVIRPARVAVANPQA
ncbi:nucleotide exchange factor GrpE [Arachnia propionica]|uniref:Protein GrpE n=1 Tax=Arachnia propionica TaxID=1750 RepID=A0A3P1T3I2_9ACTN|nr:nucleotide exchange factor GrpE [Arachnia propionica]MDO5082607.1 nucleotide exchange factor GrpE [Arachnia propionica]RRD03715.1 nucleotide exchange factor GrpE [Arachnia propionica]